MKYLRGVCCYGEVCWYAITICDYIHLQSIHIVTRIFDFWTFSHAVKLVIAKLASSDS